MWEQLVQLGPLILYLAVGFAQIWRIWRLHKREEEQIRIVEDFVRHICESCGHVSPEVLQKFVGDFARAVTMKKSPKPPASEPPAVGQISSKPVVAIAASRSEVP